MPRGWFTRSSAPPPTRPTSTRPARGSHGREEAVFADAGYTGADKRPEHEERDVSWNIAIKRGIIKALPKRLRELAEPVESALSQARAWVEHPSSTRSMWSRIGSTIRSCAIAASSRIPRNCTRCSPWPIWCPGQFGDRQERPARAGPGLITPAIRLDPANNTVKPKNNPDFRRLMPLPGASRPEISPASPNRQPTQQCSAFP